MKYEKQIENLLYKMGANRSYTGFHYLVYGVSQIIDDPSRMTYICKGVYVDTAVHFQTSMYCVERNIRTLKLMIWNHANQPILNEVMGYPADSSPKNAQFIDALSKYVIAHAQELS